MTVVLDSELKARMAEDQAVAVLWQDAEQGETALLAKAANEDIESFKGPVPIQSYWELGSFPCGSVLRLHLTIFDQPEQPYRFETFINIAAPEQRACIERLLIQKALHLHFFDQQTEHVFTKTIPHLPRQRQQLGKLIAQAIQEWEKLGENWDFDQAKALFQRYHSL